MPLAPIHPPETFVALHAEGCFLLGHGKTLTTTTGLGRPRPGRLPPGLFLFFYRDRDQRHSSRRERERQGQATRGQGLRGFDFAFPIHCAFRCDLAAKRKRTRRARVAAISVWVKSISFRFFLDARTFLAVLALPPTEGSSFRGKSCLYITQAVRL